MLASIPSNPGAIVKIKKNIKKTQATESEGQHHILQVSDKWHSSTNIHIQGDLDQDVL